MQRAKPRFRVGNICIFTNRGSSGVRSNDGKRCRITRVKRPKEWTNPRRPEYIVAFLGDGRILGVTENELALAQEIRIVKPEKGGARCAQSRR